jgi:hypothetical protein
MDTAPELTYRPYIFTNNNFPDCACSVGEGLRLFRVFSSRSSQSGFLEAQRNSEHGGTTSMKTVYGRVLAGLCLLGLIATVAAPVAAQMADNGKAPMYCYVGEWAVPRAQWADFEKADAADTDTLQKALAAGSLIGYGSDINLVHQPDGPTHDSWWCSTSMAGIVGVLESFYAAGTTTAPVMASATKHWDNILVSRYYNWHPGTMKNGYTHGAVYKLKADAPDDALDTLAKTAIVPMMEKLLSNGTIAEYEIDQESIHTAAPGLFFIFYLTPTADGLDKASKALQDTLKSNPLIGPAFDSMVDFTAHRDYLDRTSATYK